jgi:hypothetical protein
MIPLNGHAPVKSIAIVQSNYIPWRGYFDLIRAVDEFVILDSVQFTKNDWRNRNRIAANQGVQWLTIPIRTAGRWPQRIAEAEIADPYWARRHWRSIVQNYSRAPQFQALAPALQQIYRLAARETRLSRINRLFLDSLCSRLGITTRITSSEAYPDHPDRAERLIGICQAAGAGRYVSGPRASVYLDSARFAAAGIAVEFFAYGPRPEPRLSTLHEMLTS